MGEHSNCELFNEIVDIIQKVGVYDVKLKKLIAEITCFRFEVFTIGNKEEHLHAYVDNRLVSIFALRGQSVATLQCDDVMTLKAIRLMMDHEIH